MLKRLKTVIVATIFLLNICLPAGAQSVDELPLPGQMLDVSSSFAPPILKGLILDPQKPLQFQFLMDPGDSHSQNAPAQEELYKLVKYFLAGLTIPEGDLWVNLSPYEKDRIIPNELGQTVLGRDMLAEDYLLKQLSASMIFPEKDLGKEFWNRVYSQTKTKFGTTDIAVNTFSKIWIVPDKAQVYENGHAVYVTKATLKVMMEEDYLAMQKHDVKQQTTLASQITREIILPQIEQEINHGKNFASLRQIYHALILAKWYKETIQNTLLKSVYNNQKKIEGITTPFQKEEIYQRYIQAYKKGVFNYVKETPTNGQAVPRRYFSGGEVWDFQLDHTGKQSDLPTGQEMVALTVDLQKMDGAQDQAMAGPLKGEIFGRPLRALRNHSVENIFRMIVRRRYDTRVLSHYGIGPIPQQVTYENPQTGQKELLSPDQYADRLVDFMVDYLNKKDLYPVAEKFRETFPNRAVPPELQPVFDAYMKIKTKSFDLQVIKDVLHDLPPHSVIADIGAGKNQLGKELLEYSKQEHLSVKFVIGTDVVDWQSQSRKNRRLLFVHQKTGVAIPLAANSVDVVILKWVTHHITEQDQQEFFKSIWGILKPGGKLIIVDALLAEQGDPEIQSLFEKETKNPETWPEGEYTKENLQLSRAFMELDEAKQKQVLALEDIFGHLFKEAREFMPQPGTYISVSDFRRRLNRLGMKEREEFFKVFGSAPIMRMGPPSMRMVFEKLPPKANFPWTSGGENLPSMLNVRNKERQALNTVLNGLVPRTYSIAELKDLKADDIVLYASDHLDIILEALKLLDASLGRVVVLDNPHVNAVNLISNAVKWGYSIETPKLGTIKDMSSLKRMKRRLNGMPAKSRGEYIGTPPQIIRQIMLQMILSFPQFYPNLNAAERAFIHSKITADPYTIPISTNQEEGDTFPYARLLSDPYIVPLEASALDSLWKYKIMLQNEGLNGNKKEYKIIVVSDPILQYFYMAQLGAAFYTARDGNVTLLNHTASITPENIYGSDQTQGRMATIKMLLTQAQEALTISPYGKIVVLPNLKYEPEYWDALLYLLSRLDKGEAYQYAQGFISGVDTHHAAENPELSQFLKELSSMTPDQAMVSPDQKGGIDLNQIQITRQGQNKISFDAVDADDFEEGAFTGFNPVIVKVATIQNLLEFFNRNLPLSQTSVSEALN